MWTKKGQNEMKTEGSLDNKANIERVSVHTGLSVKNIGLTYINNKKKDKTGFWRALSLGAMCMEKDISMDELELALNNAEEYRELHGSS